MTYGDMLDQVAGAADDTSTEFRDKARRWLNLVRSHAAERARWKGSVRTDTFDTDASNTTGIYTLKRYSHLVEDTLYNETSKILMRHETYAQLNGIDIAKEVYGPPTFWGDAGSDEKGNHQIYLWTIPAATYTIRFTGQGLLTDVEEGDESLSIDPFFGRLTSWAPIFTAGLRYYQLDDVDEDVNQTLAQLQIFNTLIDHRKSTDRTAPVAGRMLANVRSRSRTRRAGRFDPAHYNNSRK